MRRFSAGCQPLHPHGNLIAAGIKVPGAGSPYLPGAGSISSRISKRLGFNLPKHSTAFTCRHTELSSLTFF